MGGDVREMLLVFWHLFLLVWYELPEGLTARVVDYND